MSEVRFFTRGHCGPWIPTDCLLGGIFRFGVRLIIPAGHVQVGDLGLTQSEWDAVDAGVVCSMRPITKIERR